MFAGGFDCGYEVMLNPGFHDISTNSGLRSKELQGLGIVFRHEQNFGVWHSLVDGRRSLEPVQPRHRYIYQNDVWL